MGSGDRQQLKIAVIGTGVAGLTAAWLLSQRHDVTVYERDGRVGGHCCTVRVPCGGGTTIAVDTGFIVYNEETYPNLAALFAHLNVPTQLSDMSFAVSLDGGAVEYSGSTQGLFAQKRNLFRQRFWSMLSDIRRFYREAPNDLPMLDEFHTTIGDYLKTNRYGAAFRDDHLLPMAGAIWSAPPRAILGYPAASFIRFHLNHGLLRLSHRIKWRTVKGGSRAYVDRLTATFSDRIKLERAARAVWRNGSKVAVLCSSGQLEWFDHLVVASHADEALTILDDPSGAECALLSAFRYSRNRAVLHGDVTLMPRRKSTWSSWNFIEQRRHRHLQANCAVTYWMNRLQNLGSMPPLFVTLNPERDPASESVIKVQQFEHPLFDAPAIRAQRQLWSLQGDRNTWFCGSYFGAGFHEDALQSGLAVAEALGGVRRPWRVEDESGRIFVTDRKAAHTLHGVAA
jgi:uncharacterized protein